MKILAAVLVTFLAGAASPTKVPVGQWTFGLTAGGGSVWAGTLSSGEVLRIDPATGKVTKRIPAGVRVFNLAAAPGSVWAIANGTSTVSRIDTRTGRVAKTVRVGFAPYDLEWGFGAIWVANSGEGTVSRITGGKVVKKIKTGTEPNGLAAFAGALWVSDHTLGKVTRIDPATNRVTGSVDVPGADWIVGRGGSLYVSQETNEVSKIDVASLKVVGSVATAKNPLGSAFVGDQLWVPCIDGSEIDVVDPDTMQVVERKKSPGDPLVVLPAFKHVWVSHGTANALTRY
jgi:DNA-binding beta-propeller fold protein YncE